MSSSTRTMGTHRAIGGLLALVASLAACQVQVATGPGPKKSPVVADPVRPAASARPNPFTGPVTTVATEPRPSADVGPGVRPASSAKPSEPAPTALDLLKAPPGANTL